MEISFNKNPYMNVDVLCVTLRLFLLLLWLLQFTPTMASFWFLHLIYIKRQQAGWLHFTIDNDYSFNSTYCISGDELTISTRLNNCDVLFSWYNPRKTYRYYYLTINNQGGNWIPDTEYTVKNALMNDSINITVRPEGSSKDYKLRYNGRFFQIF